MPDVNLTPSGPPVTVLPQPDPHVVAALASIEDVGGLSEIVAAHPASLDAWAALGTAYESAGGIASEVAAYAAFRVGYHRGLDALRKHGWRGSGYVRWSDPSNRGFLRCLDGLSRMAGRIGEEDEEIRCAEFLRMLDPAWERRAND